MDGDLFLTFSTISPIPSIVIEQKSSLASRFIYPGNGTNPFLFYRPLPSLQIVYERKEGRGTNPFLSTLFLPKIYETRREGKKNFRKRGHGKFASFSRVMRLRKFCFYRSGELVPLRTVFLYSIFCTKREQYQGKELGRDASEFPKTFPEKLSWPILIFIYILKQIFDCKNNKNIR